MRAFDPPRGLRSPHVQTILARTRIKASRGRATELRAEDIDLECRDGIRLMAKVTPGPADAPLVIIVHGWLGGSRSWYVERTASVLHDNGFRVACLLLRDHGGTASYNREMFNSARLGEVVDACNGLIERANATASGIVGFSLGGNFALRLAGHGDLDDRLAACLAICPVIDPAATVRAIDNGWLVYRKWFVEKWRRALDEKRAAFPEAYRDLDGAMRLSTVAGITDYLVERYLPYRDSLDYYARYDLRDKLARLRIDARIVAAADDIVVPGGTYADVTHGNRLEVNLFPHGGHCGFVEDWHLNSYLDASTVEFFRARLVR